MDYAFTITKAIHNKAETLEGFQAEILTACRRFSAGDWGELPEEDKEANNEDLKNRAGHVLGRYSTSQGAVYIESADFLTAAVMFTNER